MSASRRLKAQSGQLLFAAFVFTCLVCSFGQAPEQRRLSDEQCSCDKMIKRPTNDPGPTYRIKNGMVVGGPNELEGELASVAAIYVKYPRSCEFNAQGKCFWISKIQVTLCQIECQIECLL